MCSVSVYMATLPDSKLAAAADADDDKIDCG